MAKEVLYIPEEDLHHVIDIIRAGLKVEKVPGHVVMGLVEWCQDEEAYLRESFRKEYWPKPAKAKAKENK